MRLVHGLELGAGDDAAADVQPGLASQRRHGLGVVPGDDADVDAHLPEGGQRLGCLGSQQVAQHHDGVRPRVGGQGGVLALVAEVGGRAVSRQQHAHAARGMVGDDGLDVAATRRR